MQASGETEELFGGRNNMKNKIEELLAKYEADLASLNTAQYYFNDHDWDKDQGRICILEDIIGDLKGILITYEN